MRNHRDGFSVRICSQLFIVLSSARRKNPTSLISKPGDLKPTLDSNRIRSPPIFLMAIFAADPVSEVLVGSSSKDVAPGPLEVVAAVLLDPIDRRRRRRGRCSRPNSR